jgi:hypothetical protein
MTERDRDEDEDKLVVGLETEAETDWLKKGREQRDNERATVRYTKGEEVETPDGIGVVAEVFTSDGVFRGEEYTASEDSPTYAVAVDREDGDLGMYSADDLESGETED